jgi:PcRGLX-like N-terminal RIFT barrel domain
LTGFEKAFPNGIPITSRGTADKLTPRIHEPAACGIPLPRGLCRNADDLRLLSESGESIESQTQVIDRWPDGSARWVQVDFLASTGFSGQAHYRLQPGSPSRTPGAGPVLTIREANGQVEIDTGISAFALRNRRPFPFQSVASRQGLAVDCDKSSFRVVDASGRVHPFESTTLVVEARGPVRGTVRLEGSFGSTGLAGEVRLHFFAGSAVVRFDVMVRNPHKARHPGGFWELGDQGSILFTDLSFTLALETTTPGQFACSSVEPCVAIEAFQLPFEVYQASSGGQRWNSTNHVNRDGRVPLAFQGYRVVSKEGTRLGRRAQPVVTAGRDDGTELSVCFHAFWQNFPKAIELSSTELALRLFPHQHGDLYELQGGEQKTHTFAVSFGPDTVSTPALDWIRSPLHTSSAPEYYAFTEAIPYLVPETQDSRIAYLTLVRSAIEGADSFSEKREQIDEYGWRHFGDVYGDHEAVHHRGAQPLVSHWNNQYDTVAASAIQFLRSGDARWWHMHVEMATHVRDIDIYHTNQDKAAYNNGLFWHTSHYIDAGKCTHRTYPRHQGVHGGGPAAGHTYATGLMLHYFLTGDPWSFEAAMGLARFVVDIDDGSKTVFRWLSRSSTGKASESGTPDYHGPGRGSANSLSTLLDGHQLTGDGVFLAKAEQLIRRCIHPAENIDDRNLAFIEYRWFYTMFLQSLGKYLRYKEHLGQVDTMHSYARASLLHYARWMSQHEYVYLTKPEVLEHPTETWAAQEMRKSEVLQLAAYYSTDSSDRARFHERSELFFNSSIDGLEARPTRSLCRPVAVLMGTGWQQAWFHRYPDARPPLPAADASQDFGPPLAFTPQRTIAVRRATLLGGVLLIAALVLLVLAVAAV